MLGRIIPVLLLAFMSPDIFSQSSDNYLVSRAPFSSSKSDDFSPVVYKRSVIFISSRGRSKIGGYSAAGKTGFFKIYYVDTAKLTSEARLLPGTINSPLNNGPVTFSRNGDTIYFSRNLIVDGTFKAITGAENKLGLFYAVLKNGEWTNVTEMRFNDYSWNVTTPYMSPDGKRLYFASDRPEGFGGSDLYYSEWENGYWSNPVNLGRPVNTGGNEAYPFVNESGELFFSSDSLPGKGGKDIFFSKFKDSAWIKPVGLNMPVNSKADDFGFWSDNLLSKGYFSSNRGGMLDIYSFKTVYPQFLYCEAQKEPVTCFKFNDDNSFEFDQQQLQIKWSFGDGTSTNGPNAAHCFKKPGRYEVRENITDRRTGKPVINKLILFVNVRGFEKTYIESDQNVVVNNPVSFTAISPGNKQLMAAFWDFGPSGQEKGLKLSKSFKGTGDMQVKLLVTLKDEGGKYSRECVSKTIRVGDKNSGMQGRVNSTAGYYSVSGNSNFSELRYSAGDDISGNGVFQVQVLSSEKNIPAGDVMFNNLRPYYPVSVRKIPGENKYSYIIDEQLSFMDAYQEYSRAVSLGFRDAVITTYIPEGASRELWNFKKTFGVSSDKYFMNNGYSLSPSVVPVLDELVMVLKRNSGLKLLIASYTGNSLSTVAAQELTQKQAQNIVDYLADAGISKLRLSAAGYGSARPLSPDPSDAKNRRIDFIPVFQEQ
ncbi:MAG TPA: PKD domain-containing protein [Bacteroidales bacterium]|nr:PKD domain-containing protein [Bacteroidales bacterium]